MAFVRRYSSHAVTTSGNFDRTTGLYLSIPSCLVVSVFKGVIPGFAFEQSIRGRPAIFKRANGIYLPCGGLRALIP